LLGNVGYKTVLVTHSKEIADICAEALNNHEKQKANK